MRLNIFRLRLASLAAEPWDIPAKEGLISEVVVGRAFDCFPNKYPLLLTSLLGLGSTIEQAMKEQRHSELILKLEPRGR